MCILEKYNENIVKRGFTTLLLTTSILLGSSFVSDLPLSSFEVSAAKTTKYTTTNALNLRATNSNLGKILATIPKNKAVTYISKSGSWYKVKYNGKTGWVSSKYIKTKSTTVKTVNATSKSATAKNTTSSTTTTKVTGTASASATAAKVASTAKNVASSATTKLPAENKIESMVVYTTSELNLRASNSATAKALH